MRVSGAVAVCRMDEEGERRLMPTQKKALIALCIIGSTMYLGGGITPPSIAYIIDSYPEISPYTVSTIITVPGIVALIASFFIGPLVLRFNKKYLLLISLAITLVYFAVFTFFGGRVPFMLLMAVACFIGIHRGAGSALVNSIIGEFIEPEKRAVSIALTGAFMQGGAGLIAVFAGWIAAGNDGADWPLAHSLGFVSIITMAIFAFMMPKKPDTPLLAADTDTEGKRQPGENRAEDSKDSVLRTIKNGFRDIPPKVYLMMTLHFAFVLCAISFHLYSSIYIISEHELGTSVEAGIASSSLMFFSVVTGLTYAIWGRLFKSWIVPVGYLISALGLIIKITVTTHLAGIFIASVFLGIGWNITTPYVSSQVMALSPQKLIPVSISIHLGFQNLAMFFAPYVLRLAGGLFGGGVTGALTASAIILPVCAVAAALLFSRKVRRGAVA